MGWLFAPDGEVVVLLRDGHALAAEGDLAEVGVVGNEDPAVGGFDLEIGPAVRVKASRSKGSCLPTHGARIVYSLAWDEGPAMNDKSASDVRLSDAIGQVRSELERATEAGKDSRLAFRAGPVELEFQVAFEATAAADAGVRVWVLSAGAKGEATRSASHRLKVTLTPVDRQAKDTLIASVGSK